MRPPPEPRLPQLPPRRGGRPGPVALAELADDELMARCGKGQTAALAELMDRHQDAAHRYAWRIFRDHHTAEDMTQELFVKLFRNAARYQPRGHFTTYFYRVMANLCFDLLRKRKRRKHIHAVQLDPLLSEGTELEPLADATDLDGPMREAEAKDAVHVALGSLPVRVREALELREFEGLRYREIAEVMDVSLNEVKVYLHRGRKMLARVLSHTSIGRDWVGQDRLASDDPATGGGA